MWVWSLGWEDPLEKEVATHSSLLSWEIPWTEGPDGLQSIGSQSQTGLSDETTTEVFDLFFSLDLTPSSCLPHTEIWKSGSRSLSINNSTRNTSFSEVLDFLQWTHAACVCDVTVNVYYAGGANWGRGRTMGMSGKFCLILLPEETKK